MNRELDAMIGVQGAGSVTDAKSRTQDAELVDAARRGAADAFEELLGRYYEKLYGVIARMVREPEQARDLTQDCFLRAWRALPDFAGEASFFTWLYQIARNLVISAARRERARPKITASIDQASEDRTEWRDTSALDPAEPLNRRERRLALIQAIESLPPDFREVIVLRDLEGLAYEELAILLKVPVGTVRSRLFRARMELKTRLAETES